MLVAGARDAGGNVNEWRIKQGKERKVRERVYKGVPDRWRRAAWDCLVERWVGTHGEVSGEKGTGKGKGKETRELFEEYREALEKPSTYDIQIDLDVPRTISGHVMFRTRYGLGYALLHFSFFSTNSTH